MERDRPPDDAGSAPPREFTGRLSESERRALRERAAQARAAATEAITHYAILLEGTRTGCANSERTFKAVAATREMLRDSVQRYSVLLKSLDTPPERALRLVKEAVTERLHHPEREEETRSLLESVVVWCIEAYYGSPPAA